MLGLEVHPPFDSTVHRHMAFMLPICPVDEFFPYPSNFNPV
jgi:hypothetical protein